MFDVECDRAVDRGVEAPEPDAERAWAVLPTVDGPTALAGVRMYYSKGDCAVPLTPHTLQAKDCLRAVCAPASFFGQSVPALLSEPLL